MAARLPSRINRRYIVLSASALLVFWFWASYEFPDHVGWPIHNDSPNSDPLLEQDIFDYPPVHSSAIKAVCAKTKWNENLIFICDDNVGGIGQVRNSILNCVRFSIAAGAGMVLPRISIRNGEDISKVNTGRLTNMAYMFDTKHFIDSISLSCPDLKLFSDLDGFRKEKVNNVGDPIHLNPSVLGIKAPETGMEIPKTFGDAMPKAGIEEPEKWGERFHEWYTDTIGQYQFKDSIKGPMFIGLLRSYLTWPILSDGQAFSTQFGKILKLRADTRTLATKTLLNVAEKYKFEADIHAPILKNAFWGAHLRTESDSLESLPTAGKDRLYPTYTMQTKLFLDHMTKEKDAVNANLVYLASGDPSHVADFWKDAKVMNMTVITKSGLLQEKDLAELSELTWDQQALVDFMVLAKASRYLGVGHSGFDWALAGRREVSLLDRNGMEIPGAKEEHIKESKSQDTTGGDIELSLDTELSVLYGARAGMKAYQECMWP